MRYSLIIILMVPFLFGSCKKVPTYSTIPEINLKSVEINPNNEIVVHINFTDGDGDFGLNEIDTVAPYNSNSLYFNNLFLAYEEKINGNWQPGLDQLGNPAVYKFRISNLTPQGRNKSLKGIISTTLYLLPSSGLADTCRFKIKIIDRALQVSNEITTDEIIR